MRILAAILLLGSALPAQEFFLTTEFRRIGPDGGVIALDRGGTPREILSPAFVRGAWNSFHVAVKGPVGMFYKLFFAQNPEGIVKAEFYREHFADGVPEKLEKIELPYEGKLATGADVFWMDVWVERSAKVQRIRIETQMYVNDRWVIYPLEPRIVGAQSAGREPAVAGPAAMRSDEGAIRAMRAWLCGDKPEASAGEPSVTRFLARNVARDIGMLQALPKEQREKELWPLLQNDTAEHWCAENPKAGAYPSPEWWLRIRDFFARLKYTE